MKQFIFSALIIVIAATAYSYGQANQKHVKHCCCEHTQQIAEDIRWMREQMSKPYKAPPNIEYELPPDLSVPEFNIPKPSKPNYRK